MILRLILDCFGVIFLRYDFESWPYMILSVLYYAGIWQELVIEESDGLLDWARSLID